MTVTCTHQGIHHHESIAKVDAHEFARTTDMTVRAKDVYQMTRVNTRKGDMQMIFRASYIRGNPLRTQPMPA